MLEGTRFGAIDRSRWPWVAGAVVLVLVALLALYGLLARTRETPSAGAHGPGAAAPRSVPVLTATATTGDIGIYETGLGTVTPLSTVTVRSRVDGQLMRVLFREGQLVKEGDLLAEIDPRPFQAALEQAEGQLARDQALLANAKTDRARYELLREQDSIASQLVDTQEALVRQYEAAIQVDQGVVDNARLQLTYSRVTAPTSGRLGLRVVDPGNIVHATDAAGIVVITQIQPIAVVFSIPEGGVQAVLEKLRAGQTLTVEAWDRDQRKQLAQGTLLSIDNQIDPNTGTLRIKAQFPNDDGALFPNQFVNARLLVDTRHGSTLIPTTGVQRSPDGTFAFVVKEDQTVEMRPVRIGVTEGGQAEITQGLRPGEIVVIEGADALRNGSRVSPRAAQDASAPPASP